MLCNHFPCAMMFILISIMKANSDEFICLSIVVITTILVAATASAISSKFDTFSRIGGIIGTSVSAAFLIILGVMNIYILYKLIEQIRKLIALGPAEEQEFQIQGAGCLFQLFKKMFKLIDR